MIMLDEAFPPQIKSQLKLSDGLFYDLSGEGNVITNNGATLTADHRGRANKAFDFPIGTFINVGDIDLTSIYGANGSITFNVGFEWMSTTANRCLFNKLFNTNNEVICFVSNTSKLEFQIYQESFIYIAYDRAFEFTNGTWHFVSIVYDNTLPVENKIIFMMDGTTYATSILAQSGTFTGILNTNVPLVIGNWDVDLNSHNYEGSVGMFETINRAISLSEHQQLYNEWRK